MSQKKSILSRRNFLLTIGAGGVAAAATVATKNKQQSSVRDRDAKRATAGYSESAHIRNYYRTTKV
jgi:shikimate 5-dehydrogenase